MMQRRQNGSRRNLRRLTQAYLSPLQHQKPKVIENALNRVDHIYSLTQSLIVEHQSATTGLFPRFSNDHTVGYVKDSIYCALACWACSAAYKRLDDDRGRQTELRQTAVKTMRGILFCWMQQVDLVNHFKDKNSPEYALHARFDFQTGLPLQQAFGHLQMDLIALFILSLVQMTVGGAQIIYTQHEVAFLQNLVFYVERTYRTPDFGMWERGNRYNNGTPELHASSLGMVKAALEAVNGFNAYGQNGTSSSVIYVDIDGHDRNRTTFETMLPRESNSKHTDAALLLTIGWPAFGTHDTTLYEKTLNKIIRHLEGRYGIRRFARDGYRTEIEDPTKKYYDAEETYNFKSVESQFPMFFAHIALTAQLKGNQELADRYWEKFQNLMVPGDYSGMLVSPECYCIDEDHMDDERTAPNTQDFYAINPIEFGHHLWPNAVYLITLLLREKLIHSSDIDPIYRHLPASQRPRVVNRHSAFQRDNFEYSDPDEGSMEGDPVVQIALVAESTSLQTMLATYGISTQTPHEVEPVEIWPSWRMVKVFEALGKDKKMNLSGRPPRPFGALNTAKIFRFSGSTILCYPLIFELSDFYLNADPMTLIEDIKSDIDFVSKRWKLAGRPTICMVLREENVLGEYFDAMLDLLVSLKNGFVNGVRVRIGRVHQLLNTGCIEHVDFVGAEDVEFDRGIFEEVDAQTMRLRSKSSLRPIPSQDSSRKEKELNNLDDHTLSQIVTHFDVENLRNVAFSISIMMRRHGPNHHVNGETLNAQMEKVYRQAYTWRLWWLVRFCAAKLRKTIISLAPSITNLLVRGKQVIIGMKKNKEVVISTPSSPGEIVNAIFSSADDDDPQAAVFHQELIIACADLIAHKHDAFDGILAIRLSWLTKAMQLLLEFIKDAMNKDKMKESKKRIADVRTLIDSHSLSAMARQLELTKNSSIYDLSPTMVKELLEILMTKKNWHILNPIQTRRLNGALNRVPMNLYQRIWKILERTSGGIVIAGHELPQNPTLKIMTQQELNFSYKIEAMMGDITQPEYRQILVELLCILATIMERNPEIAFADTLNCDQLCQRAFQLFCEDNNIGDRKDMTPFYQLDESTTSAIHNLITSSNTNTTSYLLRAVMEKLLKGSNIRRKFSCFTESFDNSNEMLLSEKKKTDDSCHVS